MDEQNASPRGDGHDHHRRRPSLDLRRAAAARKTPLPRHVHGHMQSKWPELTNSFADGAGAARDSAVSSRRARRSPTISARSTVRSPKSLAIGSVRAGRRAGMLEAHLQLLLIPGNLFSRLPASKRRQLAEQSVALEVELEARRSPSIPPNASRVAPSVGMRHCPFRARAGWLSASRRCCGWWRWD